MSDNGPSSVVPLHSAERFARDDEKWRRVLDLCAAMGIPCELVDAIRPAMVAFGAEVDRANLASITAGILPETVNIDDAGDLDALLALGAALPRPPDAIMNLKIPRLDGAAEEEKG